MSSGSAFADDVGLRVRFGLNDTRTTDWSGAIEVTPGRVTHISGWRFTKQDSIDENMGWTASTRPLAQQARGNNQKKAKANAKKRDNNASQPMADIGVTVSMTDVTEASVISIKTKHGSIDIPLSEIAFGNIVEKLDGAIELERAAGSVPVTSLRVDDDYPSAAVTELLDAVGSRIFGWARRDRLEHLRERRLRRLGSRILSRWLGVEGATGSRH